MLVDDLGQTNRPVASRMPEVEDDGSDGGAGLPAGCSSMERVRASRRSLWTHRQGEGWSVAKVAANGGDGHARWSRGRETEEGKGMQRVRERREGTRGVVVARIRTKGGLQREAGGGRGARARATPGLCLLAEEDDERRGRWAGLGRGRSWARQVSR